MKNKILLAIGLFICGGNISTTEYVLSSESSTESIADHFMISAHIVKELTVKIKAYLEGENNDREALLKTFRIASALCEKAKEYLEKENLAKDLRELLYEVEKNFKSGVELAEEIIKNTKNDDELRNTLKAFLPMAIQLSINKLDDASEFLEDLLENSIN